MSTATTAVWGQTRWFLITPPHPLPGVSGRYRLLSRLAAGIEASDVVLLAAPSGYGKTVLLSSFVADGATPTAWLTLTRHDRDSEEAILSGILASVDHVDLDGRRPPAPTATTSQIAPGAVRDLYDTIARVVAGLPDALLMVIDDAHHAGPVLGEIVEVLANVTGRRMRFAVAGLPSVATGFTRRIAADPTILIGPDELAMSVDEIKSAAAERAEHLDDTTAALRRDETGGWPIALDLRRAWNEVGTVGPDSLFVDFIDVNVLATLPDDLREFVLAATTCGRVTAGLAAALSGREDAPAALEAAVVAGLPVARTADPAGRVVYHWHDAFADACRRIVARRDPTRAVRLELVAAQSLVDGYPAEALGHAARASDPALLLSIIRSAWLRILIESGAHALQNSCLALPAAYLDHPEVLAVRACCRSIVGDAAGARMLAARAAAAGDADLHFSATFAFAQLFLLDDQHDLARAVDDARRILDSGQSDAAMHPYRVFVVGWTLLRLRRDPPGAALLLRTALDEARAAHRPVLERRAASNLLFALSFAGRFADADVLLDDRITADHVDDDWGHYDDGIGLFAFGFGEFWRGRIDEAAAAFTTLAGGGGHDTSYAALGRVYQVVMAVESPSPAGLADAAAHVAAISSTQAHGMPWHLYRAFASGALYAARGDVTQAITLLELIADEPHVPVIRVLGADIARRAGLADLALRLLSGLSPMERALSYVGAAADTTAALIHFAAGDTTVAHHLLEQALDAAAPADVRQMFRRGEPLLIDLLAAHAVHGTRHPEFVAARLAERHPSSASAGGGALTAREQEILAYLRTSMTANEIAAELFVSVSTVRTHLRSIYRKLGVAGRREAVQLRL